MEAFVDRSVGGALRSMRFLRSLRALRAVTACSVMFTKQTQLSINIMLMRFCIETHCHAAYMYWTLGTVSIFAGIAILRY